MLYQRRLSRSGVPLDPKYPIMVWEIGAVVLLFELGGFEELIASRRVGQGDVLPASVNIQKLRDLF